MKCCRCPPRPRSTRDRVSGWSRAFAISMGRQERERVTYVQGPARCRDKVRTLDALGTIAAEERGQGKRIVLCHGCFDILHPGHLRYLNFAREQGDCLVVTVTEDASVAKGVDRPYVPQDLRVEALAALEIVDYVAICRSATAEPAIRGSKTSVRIK